MVGRVETRLEVVAALTAVGGNLNYCRFRDVKGGLT